MNNRFCDFDELDRNIILVALKSSNRTDLPYVQNRIQTMIWDLEPPPSCTVRLLSYGTKKIGAIKIVREGVPGLGLAEAKSIVERAPTALPIEFSKNEAERLVSELLNIGATAEVVL